MPYIRQAARNRFDDLLSHLNKSLPCDAGELNYLITKICDRYLTVKNPNYAVINEIVGVVECVKQEFYRRVASPYEDVKIRTNGDVYGDVYEIK